MQALCAQGAMPQSWIGTSSKPESPGAGCGHWQNHFQKNWRMEAKTGKNGLSLPSYERVFPCFCELYLLDQGVALPNHQSPGGPGNMLWLQATNGTGKGFRDVFQRSLEEERTEEVLFQVSKTRLQIAGTTQSLSSSERNTKVIYTPSYLNMSIYIYSWFYCNYTCLIMPAPKNVFLCVCYCLFLVVCIFLPPPYVPGPWWRILDLFDVTYKSATNWPANHSQKAPPATEERWQSWVLLSEI